MNGQEINRNIRKLALEWNIFAAVTGFIAYRIWGEWQLIALVISGFVTLQRLLGCVFYASVSELSTQLDQINKKL